MIDITIIGKHVKDGLTLETVIIKANPLKKYHESWNWGFITTERMTTQVYNDLKKAHDHAAGDHDHNH